MNKDLKEILDNVKKCCDITKDQSFVVYQREDILKVLDYINNLQQYYNDNVNKYEELIEKYFNLQEENKRLNNIIDVYEKFLISVKQFAYLDKLKELKEGSDNNGKDEL